MATSNGEEKCSKETWDFGLVYEAELLSRLSRGRDGRTGYEEVFGQTPNIAEYLDFEFYDLVWWWDRGDKNSSTADPKRLARWLGISHNCRLGIDTIRPMHANSQTLARICLPAVYSFRL